MPPDKTITAEALRVVLENTTRPIWDCDEAMWARERRVEYPLTHYDRNTFEQGRREGDPEARLASDQGSLLRYLEKTWPGSRLEIKAQGGKVAIEIVIAGLEMGVSGEFRGHLPLSEINRGLALAFSNAHERATHIKQRFFALEDVAAKAPPVRDWPIEELKPGSFAPVNHEFRLAASPFMTREGAERNADMHRGGLYGTMQRRDRYELVFPAAEPAADLVWMTGTPESVLKDGYRDGPESEPDVLALRMEEGDILIGTDRRGAVQVVREKGPDGLTDVEGGLDGLRARQRDEGPQP